MDKFLTVGELRKKLHSLPQDLPIKHYTKEATLSIRDCRIVMSEELSKEEDFTPKPLFVCIY